MPFLAVQAFLDGNLEPLGRQLGRSWASFELNLALLGDSWPPLGSNLKPLGRLLDPSWSQLGALGRLLGPTWSLLGASWALLGASWTQLGDLGRFLGAFLCPVHPFVQLSLASSALLCDLCAHLCISPWPLERLFVPCTPTCAALPGLLSASLCPVQPSVLFAQTYLTYAVLFELTQ